VIRGLVYLTGLITLGLVACVIAVSHKVHEWPWGEYVREGSEILAEKLDPRVKGERRDTVEDAAPERGEDDPDVAEFTAPPRPPRQVRHTVRRGDTLYNLSGRYYDDPLLWERIADANDIRKPSDMRVGRVLVIPQARPEGSSAARDGARRRDHDRPYDLRLAITPALEAVGTQSGGAGQ